MPKIIHRMTMSKEFKAWINARNRCYLTSDVNYKNYGARGIKMCSRWKTSFLKFYEDMGKAPSLKHTLERKDRNKDYKPGNCCWATYKVQANNRRGNRPLTFNGKTQNMSQWTEELGFKKHLIIGRLRSGWSIERALTTKQIVHKVSKK